MNMDNEILVRKLDQEGVETWRYTGSVLERGENFVRLEAFFDRQDMDFFGMSLQRGDRFVEVFYTDRWYNVFEIHAQGDDHLKGWYCNIGFPAEITPQQVSYRDLALDLLVFPDGRQVVLDEAEFQQLDLPKAAREQAWQALKNLQDCFSKKT